MQQLPEKIYVLVFTPPKHLKKKFKNYPQIIDFDLPIKNTIYEGNLEAKYLYKSPKIQKLENKHFQFGVNHLRQVGCFDENDNPICDRWTESEKLFLQACLGIVVTNEDEDD